MRIAPKQMLTRIIPIILIPDWSQPNAPLVGLWEFLALLYSLFALCSVDTVQINMNIVARSVLFIFIFYPYWDFIYVQWTWGSSHSLDTLVFSVWLRSVIHSTHPCVLFALPIWLPRSTSFVQSSVSKHRSGYPWVWRFRLLDPFCAL